MTQLVIDFSVFLWYNLHIESERNKIMNEEQREEQRLTALDQQRKVVERVKRWNESVKKVQEMQKNWKKVNG